MLTDMRFALRGLRRTPVFSLVAVATLALGIGGTSAMFTVVDRMVLNPLPFPDSPRLVLIWGSKPHEGLPEIPFSQPDFEDLRAQARSFDAVAAWAPGRGTVAGAGEPEQVQYAVVTADIFTILGTPAQAGRLFREEEDRPGTEPVAVISDALWERRFGRAPDAVGRVVRLEQQTLEIVGVLPRDFRFNTFPNETDLWLPFGADPSPGRAFARGLRSMGVIARLAPGVALEQARAEGEAIAAALAQAHPRFNTGRRFLTVPLQEQVVRGVRPAAYVLLAGVAVVLVIACANVAGLLLARGSARQRELTVRTALGASRGRLARHLLAESLVLAAAGGTAGLLLAVWLVDLIARLPWGSGSFFVPYSVARDAIAVDGRAALFTMALSLATAALAGVLPALAGSRPGVPELLRAGTHSTAGRRQQRTRGALVALEMALALVLLAGAGLAIHGYIDLQRVNPGFSGAGVLTLDVALSRSSYREPRSIAAYYSNALTRLRALPGVQAAGAVEFLPLSGRDASTGILIEGRPAPARADVQRAHHRSISPGYFQAMGIGIVQGRAFTDRDEADAARVAMVNETMAQRYWPGARAIGKRLALDFETMKFFPDRPPVSDIAAGMREIVGVVRDVRHDSLQAAPVPEMYTPLAQRPVHEMTLVVRAGGDPAQLAAAARNAVRGVDPAQPAPRLEAMSAVVAASIARPRSNFVLLTVFAGMALALAVVGVYGILAYAVSLRIPELGIRVALGGRPQDLRNLVLKQYARLVGAGLALGVPLAYALASTLRQTFSVESDRPVLLATLAAAVMLAAVALTASLVPARRAGRVNPQAALRAE